MNEEDEAFLQLERQLEDREISSYLRRAMVEAARFTHDHRDSLEIMTLRKAFEMGYRKGFTDGRTS